MTKYKCGHESKPVFMKNDIVALASYMHWKETTGFEGTNEECYECYCRKGRKETKEWIRKILSKNPMSDKEVLEEYGTNGLRAVQELRREES